MWYDDRKEVSNAFPESHQEHASAKVYMHHTQNLNTDLWDGPPARLFVDSQVIEYKWYCAYCGAEGADIFTVKYVKEAKDA